MKGGESMDMESKKETNMNTEQKQDTPEMVISNLRYENKELKKELSIKTKQVYKLMEHINTITNIAKLIDEKTQNY